MSITLLEAEQPLMPAVRFPLIIAFKGWEKIVHLIHTGGLVRVPERADPGNGLQKVGL